MVCSCLSCAIFPYEMIKKKKLKERIIRAVIAKPLNSILKRIETVQDFREDIHKITYWQYLSSNNFIVELYDGGKLYVPHFYRDGVQYRIVDTLNYYEREILDDVSGYIPDNAVVYDVGAMIGNHSLYWFHYKKAVVHCFEPLPINYNILIKNIEINHAEDFITANNIGCSDKTGTTKVKAFDAANFGGTQLDSVENRGSSGNIKLTAIDQYTQANSDKIDKLDLIKIDVEGMEYPVLKGSINTIKNFKPLIWVEIIPKLGGDLNKVAELMNSLSYELIEEYADCNYLFRHH